MNNFYTVYEDLRDKLGLQNKEFNFHLNEA